MAVSSSALPNSTGPALSVALARRTAPALIDQCLIHDRMPTSSGEIAIDNDEPGGAHGQQREARRCFVQQQLTGAEQNSVDQHTSGGPIQQIAPSVARGPDFRGEAGNGSPSGGGGTRAAVELEQHFLRFGGGDK